MSWRAHLFIKEGDDPAVIAKKVSSPTKSTNDALLTRLSLAVFSALVEQITAN